MTENPQPMIQLDWNVMWCSRHLEPYRAEWPKGSAVAMFELASRAMMMPAIMDLSNRQIEKVPAAFERFKPICCFVSSEDLAEVYRISGMGTS